MSGDTFVSDYVPNEYDRQVALALKANDLPFYSLIMAAMMRADSTNLRLLRTAYPDVYEGVRGNTPG
jgi:hypothetical protein